jgi:hypothetical protein
MTNRCVCDVSCQASHLCQLVREISKLAEIIYNLGISTHQSRKLFTFLPDTSAHQMFHIFIGRRSKYIRDGIFSKSTVLRAHSMFSPFYPRIQCLPASRSLVTPNQTKINKLPVRRSATLWQDMTRYPSVLLGVWVASRSSCYVLM